jgi:hypothetical protein
MRYKIVRIELKDDDTIILFLKKVGSGTSIIPKADLSDPVKLIEFSMHMGMNVAKKLEELTQFDAYIPIDYEEYNLKDLKVGDLVEIDIRQIEKP